MAEYKGIKGFQVQTRTEDPSPTEAQTGDFYYNSSTGQFKQINTGGAPIGTWASGGALNTGRGFSQSFGTQTAAIMATGYTNTNVNNVENYNGTSWTEVAEVNTARRELMGFGTAPAGLICGGRPPTTGATETWNGSSWTEANDLNTGRSDHFGSWGTSTSGIVASGYTTTNVASVETWDGSSWTETTDVNTARYYSSALGATNTSGLLVSGSTGTQVSNVESWDGSSWTETTELNTPRYALNSSGTDSSGIVFSGQTAPPTSDKTLTEFWNGSSWTEVADMATARYGAGGSSNGSSSSALAFGGFPGQKTNTEEFTGADFQIKTVTQS